jgi:hypothetical protein
VLIGATAFPVHGYAGRAKDLEDLRMLRLRDRKR